MSEMAIWAARHYEERWSGNAPRTLWQGGSVEQRAVRADGTEL